MGSGFEEYGSGSRHLWFVPSAGAFAVRWRADDLAGPSGGYRTTSSLSLAFEPDRKAPERCSVIASSMCGDRWPFVHDSRVLVRFIAILVAHAAQFMATTPTKWCWARSWGASCMPTCTAHGAVGGTEFVPVCQCRWRPIGACRPGAVHTFLHRGRVDTGVHIITVGKATHRAVERFPPRTRRPSQDYTNCSGLRLGPEA